MKSHILAFAAMAAIGFSGSAFAEDAAGAKTAGAPTAMTDSEMDNVTAGNPANPQLIHSFGLTTAGSAGADQLPHPDQTPSGVNPGGGLNTVISVGSGTPGSP